MVFSDGFFMIFNLVGRDGVLGIFGVEGFLVNCFVLDIS